MRHLAWVPKKQINCFLTIINLHRCLARQKQLSFTMLGKFFLYKLTALNFLMQFVEKLIQCHGMCQLNNTDMKK